MAVSTPTASQGISPTGVFRPEIEGLRTVAAFLVAVYHVWFDRVSGGVDIFFVVSGFLITGSLVRQYEHRGSIQVMSYLRRIARRILPAAFLVLGASLLGSLAIISRAYRAQTLSDIAAASVYLANLSFADRAVDYLAQDEPQSVVLHYWALSIQGQFYLLWPFFILGLAGLARRRGAELRRILLPAIAAVFTTSLAYSMFLTTTSQQVAYFSTPARIWEFALGGILALTLERLRVSRGIALTLATVGLAAILSVGALLDVAAMFPGYAALIPTLAAVALIVAGENGIRSGPIALLSSRTMTYLGGVSYAFFLWHWPIYILVRTQLGHERLSLSAGSLVLLASLGLAITSTRILEEPIRRRSTYCPRFSRVEAITFLIVPTLLVGLAVGYERATAPDSVETEDGSVHPGAMALGSGVEVLNWEDFNDPAVPIIPDPASARGDRPAPYEDGCHQNQRDSEPIACAYGEPESQVRIFLVGGSHSTHWQPTLETLGQQRGWAIVNVTKSACRFEVGGSDNESCLEWNDGVIDLLARESPNLVVTTATVAVRGAEEQIPSGFVEQWSRVSELGIPVVAIRDNPWFGTSSWGVQVPECVSDFGYSAQECLLERSDALASNAPWIGSSHDFPTSVRFVDLTDNLCSSDICWPVIGNILAYRDGHHFTVPFARSLAPALDRELQNLAPELYG